MEDEAQHNIEEEKRKSRILTDVSNEFAKAPILKCSESGISGSLGPRTAGLKFVRTFLCSGPLRLKFGIIWCLIRDFKIGPSSNRMLSKLTRTPRSEDPPILFRYFFL